MVRLETLDRRTCETIDSTSPPLAAEKAAPFVATVSGNAEPKGDGKELESAPGWVRTHRHKVYDSLITGKGKEPGQNVSPTYVTVHGQCLSLL